MKFSFWWFGRRESQISLGLVQSFFSRIMKYLDMCIGTLRVEGEVAVPSLFLGFSGLLP